MVEGRLRPLQIPAMRSPSYLGLDGTPGHQNPGPACQPRRVTSTSTTQTHFPASLPLSVRHVSATSRTITWTQTVSCTISLDVSIGPKLALGENCALAANQSVDCHVTTLFTIGLNSAKVWNRAFNWPVFGVPMHKKGGVQTQLSWLSKTRQLVVHWTENPKIGFLVVNDITEIHFEYTM